MGLLIQLCLNRQNNDHSREGFEVRTRHGIRFGEEGEKNGALSGFRPQGRENKQTATGKGYARGYAGNTWKHPRICRRI